MSYLNNLSTIPPDIPDITLRYIHINTGLMRLYRTAAVGPREMI